MRGKRRSSPLARSQIAARVERDVLTNAERVVLPEPADLGKVAGGSDRRSLAKAICGLNIQRVTGQPGETLQTVPWVQLATDSWGGRQGAGTSACPHIEKRDRSK